MIPSRRPAVHSRRVSRVTGFTLIEVLVVVVILGILAAVAFPQLLGRPDEARVVRARAAITPIVTALNMYRVAHFDYPSTHHALEPLANTPPGVPNCRSHAKTLKTT